MTHNCIAISKKNLIKGTKIDNQSFMKNLPTFLFLCVLILTSCKTDTKTSIEESKQFDYRAYLLKNNNQVPTFKFAANTNTEEIFKLIDNYTQQDCFDIFSFNYKITGYEIQSVAAEYCHNPLPPSNPTILRWKINQNNELLFNYSGTIEYIDVKNQTLQFLNEIERDNKRFLLKYEIDKSADKVITEKILDDIIEAYLEFATKLYKKENIFNINLASQEQLDDFKRKHGISILFDNWDHFKTPPPPPLAPPAPIIEDSVYEEIVIE